MADHLPCAWVSTGVEPASAIVARANQMGFARQRRLLGQQTKVQQRGTGPLAAPDAKVYGCTLNAEFGGRSIIGQFGADVKLAG